jgi:hypothetical protein
MFLVRVRGQLDEKSRIRFGENVIRYQSSDDKQRSFNFNLDKVKIRTDANRNFSFAIYIPADEKATVSLYIFYEYDQFYELSIALDSQGIVKFAQLKPVFGFEKKKRFCIKEQAWGSLGMTIFSYAQDIEQPAGSLNYISNQLPSLSGEMLLRHSSTLDEKIEFKSAPGSVPSSNALPSGSFRWMIAAFHLQQRSINWNRAVGDTMMHPYLRYGIQLHSMPIVHFSKRDEAALDTMMLANASGGAGLNLFRAQRWMMDAYLNLQYPLWAQQKIGYGLMFDGGIQVLYAYNREWAFGMNTYGQYQSFQYDRG